MFLRSSCRLHSTSALPQYETPPAASQPLRERWCRSPPGKVAELVLAAPQAIPIHPGRMPMLRRASGVHDLRLVAVPYGDGVINGRLVRRTVLTVAFRGEDHMPCPRSAPPPGPRCGSRPRTPPWSPARAPNRSVPAPRLHAMSTPRPTMPTCVAALSGSGVSVRKPRPRTSGRRFVEPDYALGWTGLADYYGEAVSGGAMNHLQALPQGEALARKAAVALDDQLPEAHLSLGASILFSRWDWAHAKEEISRALELNPRLVQAIHFRAGDCSAWPAVIRRLSRRKRPPRWVPSRGPGPWSPCSMRPANNRCCY